MEALALAKKNPSRRRNVYVSKPVELLKLALDDLADNLKPELPPKLHIQKEERHTKAITDYLKKNVIKERVTSHWSIDFHENTRLIFTILVEYSYKAKKVIPKLLLYCIAKKSFRDNYLNEFETAFLIVDCGGGTVDLTTRKLLKRAGDFCGSTFIDKEFLKFLEFCENIKIPYTGDSNFSCDFDLDRIYPVLMQYVTGEAKTSLEEKEWIIEVYNDYVKEMFDPIVERIIRLISVQLENSHTCGGFSESKYLKSRVKKEFQSKVAHILIPPEPTAAVVRGAVI
ncbi:7179_t:CDS:2 [Gigaspora margarita]|uniref:7179_t:CDS:1 n=1 Tax=Gigaspora margarita TaxID=4874 RepID=A0ABM8W5G3_GIGMA|nr:7179_t:CDS:2 [Gigaspora margarita]